MKHLPHRLSQSDTNGQREWFWVEANAGEEWEQQNCRAADGSIDINMLTDHSSTHYVCFFTSYRPIITFWHCLFTDNSFVGVS